MPDLDLDGVEALFVFARGFNDKQLFSIMRPLENRGCGISILAPDLELIPGRLPIIPDFSFENVNPDEFDLIILGNYKQNLKRNNELKEILLKMHEKEKFICCIGNSKDVLKSADLLKEPLPEHIVVAENESPDVFLGQITEKLSNRFLDDEDSN